MNDSTFHSLKVPVTLSALVQRLRRHHAHEHAEHEHVEFCSARTEAIAAKVGRWFVIDDGGQAAIGRRVRRTWNTIAELADYARDVGVLKAHEEVVGARVTATGRVLSLVTGGAS